MEEGRWQGTYMMILHILSTASRQAPVHVEAAEPDSRDPLKPVVTINATKAAVN